MYTDSANSRIRVAGICSARCEVKFVQLLNVDVQKAQAELEKPVTSTRMIQQVEGKKCFYIAEGERKSLGGYGEETGNSTTKRVRLGCGGWI